MTANDLRANQILNQFSRLLVPSAELRPLAQQQLLFWLAADPHCPTPSALADALNVSKAAVTKMAAPLVAQALVVKRTAPSDSRSVNICLTPAGQAELERLRPTYFKPMYQVAAGLGQAQFATLLHLLQSANAILLKANAEP